MWLNSEDILAEYKEVLKRLHVRSAAIGTLINFIREQGESVEIRSSAEISPDPKDNALIRSAVRPMLIGAVEESPKIWVYAQCVEIIPACLIQPDGRRVSIDLQAGR